MHYKSSLQLLGLPLVHVAVGPAEHGAAAPGVAKGWIAIGDVAFGVLFASGGVAIGALSVGGVAVGACALAGLSLGIWSVGGLALGVLAVGGAAFGYSAALGGMAAGGEFAVGGFAIAPHANDAAAQAYFHGGGLFGLPAAARESMRWLFAVAVGIAAMIWNFADEKDAGRPESH